VGTRSAGGNVGAFLLLADVITAKCVTLARPITVHQDLIDRHFYLLARFLTQTLRAAEWARNRKDEVLNMLRGETRTGREGVNAAYRDGFHLSLAPDLSTERVELFRQQKNFQLTHGFLDRNFDFDA